jgi:DNA-binding transcriptional ArsR family regulator
MPMREQHTVSVLELVVPGKRETDTLAATVLAALTNELPTRRIIRVDLRREVADLAVHLSEQLGHATLTESRLQLHDLYLPTENIRYLFRMSTSSRDKTWRFLSNHTQVLLCIQRDPDARFRDIAQMVGITERAAQRIVADLIESGYVESERIGRRNRYRIDPGIAMRHPAQDGHDIGELLRLLKLEAD